METGWVAIEIRSSRKLTLVGQTEKGMSLAGTSRSDVLGRGNSKCKDPEVGTNLTPLRNGQEASGAGEE